MTTSELAAAVARTRDALLKVEQLSVVVDYDEELDSRIAIARLAILDVADRVDQLRADRILADLNQTLAERAAEWLGGDDLDEEEVA